tara:strand:- start:487 stop:669 length:183 start_codon:yes stop_codon:yes gene_type:complete
MNATFITSGEVTHCGIFYLVGRLGLKTPIRLSSCLPEYYLPNHKIKIDEYGNPWVKGEIK